MTYLQALKKPATIANSRIIVLSGNSLSLKYDTLFLLRKFSAHPHKIIFLKPDDKQTLVKRIQELKKSNEYAIIFTTLTGITKMTNSNNGVVVVRCNNTMNMLTKHVQYRCKYEDKNVDKETALWLMKLPFDKQVKTFQKLSLVKNKQITLNTLRKYNIIYNEIELLLAYYLIEQGKRSLRLLSQFDINAKQFFLHLTDILELLIEVKSTSRSQLLKLTTERKIPLSLVYHYKRLSEKFTLTKLIERLAFIYKLIPYSRFKGVLTVLTVFKLYW